MGNVPSCSPQVAKPPSNMDDPNYVVAKKDVGSEKILYCIRHAQSESNKARRNVSTYLNTDFWSSKCDVNIKDPQLSAAGEKQVAKLQRILDNVDFVTTYNIDVVYTSPFSRAIDTALGLFKYNPSIRIIVHPDLRPHYKSAQSTGTMKKSGLELKYKSNENISFDHITHEIWWNPKNINEQKEQNVFGQYDDDNLLDDDDDLLDDDYDDEKEWQNAFDADNLDPSTIKYETKEEFLERIARFKHWLSKRSEHNIVMIGHCGYFRQFLNMWSWVSNCSIVEAHFDGKTETVTHTASVNFS